MISSEPIEVLIVWRGRARLRMYFMGIGKETGAKIFLECVVD